jgi:hypothetical protein
MNVRSQMHLKWIMAHGTCSFSRFPSWTWHFLQIRKLGFCSESYLRQDQFKPFIYFPLEYSIVTRISSAVGWSLRIRLLYKSMVGRSDRWRVTKCVWSTRHTLLTWGLICVVSAKHLHCRRDVEKTKCSSRWVHWRSFARTRENNAAVPMRRHFDLCSLQV